MSGQDLSFLAWDSPARPMQIAVRAVFEGTPPALPALQALFAARVAEEPRLRSRLAGRSWQRASDFRIERHVRSAPGRDTASLLRARLDPAHPLWEIWLVADEPSGFSLLLKIHHVLIDGVAGVALLERLLGGRPQRLRAPAASRRPHQSERIGVGATLRFIAAYFRRGDDTVLNGDVNTPLRHRDLVVDAAAFDEAAKRLASTPNDLLLAVVAGAIARWLPGEAPRRLRAFCPVSLRARGESSDFGNLISPWIVSLPTAESSLESRVRAIEQQTRRMKRLRAERGGEGMARVVARLGGWVAQLGMWIAGRRRAFSVVVTNVPGPRPIELAGVRLTRLVGYAPLFPGQRLSLALVRYDGRLSLGVTEGFPDSVLGRRFVEALGDELADLVSRAPVGDGRGG